MSDNNPYAPPSADVADLPTVGAQPAFFPVSLLKLTVLSLCSLGLYELYWFYKNWQLIRARERSDVTPFLRAFFAVLFCYACFDRIKSFGRSAGVTPPVSAGACAIGWIITSLCWRLPDPYWFASFGAVLFMLPVQAYVNRVNQHVAPDHDPNSRFTTSTWLTVVFGGAFLAMAIIGAFLPEE